MTRKLFAFALALLTAASAWAYDFKSGDLYYNITDEAARTVEVTSYATKPTGTLDIPATVSYYNISTYSVTSIGESAFEDCSALTQVTLPNGVTSIGDDAFRGCSALKQITIGNGVTSIGSNAFDGCSALTQVTIPGSVTSIGDWAFRGCSALAQVTIGDGVESIGNSAFYDCSALTQVTLPNSVESIGSYAFHYCYALTQVTIPSSVTSIGDYAFSSCYALTQVTIGDGVESIGNGAFYRCSALTAINVESGNTTYCSENGILFNKNKTTLIQYPASKTGTAYAIPESVTSIGDYAFSSCYALTQVTWNAINCADSKSSDYSPFYDSRSNITAFTFGNQVEHIPAYLCYGMDKLTQVTLPNSVTSIGNYAFYGCSALTQVTIPGSVTSIGGSAFSWCSALTQVTWNAINCADFSHDYNTYPFFDCPVTDFTFGDQVEHIPAYLCYGMDKLTTVIISDNVTSIGAEAFSSSGVVSLAIPAKATEFGADAFMDCNKLATVFYRGNMAEWCNISFENNYANPLSCAPKTVNLHIDNKVIKELTIPEGITAISDYCFYNAAFLTSLDISSSITNIGESAFAGCTALDSIYCRASVPPTIMPTTFDGVDRFIPLYIPEGKIMDYMFAPYWNEFTNLHTMPATALQTPSMPESIRVYGGLLHNPQGLPVSIYDMQGRMVYSGTAATVSQPAGVYVLRCAGASSKVLF